MTRELHFIHECRCYVVRWLSNPSIAAARDHWQSLIEDPEFELGYSALHDMRGREFTKTYEETVSERDVYRRDVEPRVGDGRTAILVDSVATYGQARQMTLMLNLEDSSVVTYSEEEAKRWVGLPAEYVFPYRVAAPKSSDPGAETQGTASS